MKEIEIYIHIPFCIKKCNYCDFLSFPSSTIERENYVNALMKEITWAGNSEVTKEDVAVRSIFFGGGTPSILSASYMEKILSSIKASFVVKEDAEISMEANPGTLNKEKLQGYREAGFNRLSIGLQSTDDVCLKKLGRIHTYQEFEENYKQARDAGFSNINIDLMSALPGQTLSSYEDTLRIVTSLEPEHISSYSLILEEGTPFYEDETLIRQLPPENEERMMYERTKEILALCGYERYEISNYAKHGKECIHNLGYWDNVPYLGFGLGASSYWKGARYSNTSDMASYLGCPTVPLEKREDYHVLSLSEQMEEFMFLGLRKMNGVKKDQFSERFHRPMEEVYGKVIEKYKNMSLLYEKKGRIALTDHGIDVCNQIFCDFLL